MSKKLQSEKVESEKGIKKLPLFGKRFIKKQKEGEK